METYQRDPYLTSLRTRVAGRGEADRGAYLLLEDTICYPEGGGQPADRGSVDSRRVHDVQRGPDGIRHFVDDAAAFGNGAEVTVELDWRRRFDHMQQHTAQHLLTAVAQDRFGWPTTAFHLGDRVSDIELDVPQLDADGLLALEQAVAAEIRAARSVRAREVDPREMERLEVRTRGLPEPVPPKVRLVEIEGIDRNTCGGTHVRSTAEIEAVKLIGTEPMRGGTRLFFVAGRRLAKRLDEHERRNAELRELLGTGDDELPHVAALKLEQLKEALRTSRKLGEALADEVGRALALTVGRDGPAAPQVARLPVADGKLLQLAARRFAAEADDGIVLLLGGDGPEGPFVLAAAEGTDRDIASLGRVAAEALGGRGGGKGIFQGKAARVDRADDALRALIDAMH
jgi:alanyl-tRNA synthetase